MIFEFLQSQFLSLAQYVTDANKRLYFGYVFSAFIIALVLYLRDYSFTQTLQKLFNQRIWLSHTAKQDYAILILNKLCRALFITPFLFAMLPIALTVTDGLTFIFGHLRAIQLPRETIWFVFTFVLFIIDDLTRFLLHLALHKVPVLWVFHQVHHSAETLTPFTVYRSHPIENALYAARMILAQGLAVGICYYGFGPKLKMVDILGANLFIFIFNMLGSNLRHSHVWWHWGVLENIFISPAQHQLHHSDNKMHIDCNLGTALSIWDKFCGTSIKSTQKKPTDLAFGLHNNTIKRSLFALYTQPFTDLIKRLFNTNSN
ncbi:sterol desaturase family protein [Algibacillus agarilyticus]|uniref:sterol desaturase family protein n=1 Tax=Algibacillus agarilyticus TaxID=2234133 RepID=UPI000DCF8D46|nr:sterol desaturase family protein [Algibacillus agarilyticus]